MTKPLSLICAKLALLDLKDGFRKYSCIVISCSTVITHDRLVRAEELSCRYLSQNNSEKYDEQIRNSMCKLACLLLCSDYEKKLCNEIVTTWAKPHCDKDLFQLFELNISFFQWKCSAEHCNSAYVINHSKAITIIEALTLDMAEKQYLNCEKRKKLFELFLLLHCDNSC